MYPKGQWASLARFLLAIVLACVLAVGSIGQASAAKTIYVKAEAGGDDNGTSWTNAYDQLEVALDVAEAGDQIWVAAGVYKPTTTTLRTSTFYLATGVAVYGGFAGGETLRSQRNPAANVTVLSGDIGTPGVATDNSYHVVTGTLADSTAILDGFTVTGGNANGSSWDALGGGMFSELGSPTLTNVTFSGNSAGEYGGGMYNYNGSNPSLTNVTFNGNSAGDSGGAIYDYESSPTLTNVTFSGNTAATSGGGMFNHKESYPALTNVTFGGNSASKGSGMFNSASEVTIKDTIFWGDSKQVENSSSTGTITDTIIQGCACPVGATCKNIINANPKLGALANNGGFTKTMALGPGSAAIDAGGVTTTCASKDQRGVTRPQGGKCDIGAYEVRTITFRSVGAHDGWVLESGETTNVGGTMDSASGTIRLGDDASDKQYRGLLSFNTASLADTATVVFARVKIRKQAITGTDPFTTHGKLALSIKKPYFGTALGLEIGDFQAAPGVDPAGSIASMLVSGWYAGVLSTGALSSVNKTGMTQLRLRFTIDDNNDNGADYLGFYSGNATSAYRPLLIVYCNP